VFIYLLFVYFSDERYDGDGEDREDRICDGHVEDDTDGNLG